MSAGAAGKAEEKRETMQIGILGSGIVGDTLSNGFLNKGHSVMRGTREPQKLADWKAKAGDRANVGSFGDAAGFGELVILAVKGGAAEKAVELCGSGLDGKVVIDTTNPIADKPPVNGVLQFFTGQNESLLERLQLKAPKARFVKAFSCVGAPAMIDPDFGGQKPSMFICGNDESARAEVARLLAKIGWDVEDMGSAEAARAIEPLCMLWCIPGLRGGGWSHAFKLLKK
jgi:predicted dinucleotide-binding enzyme